MIYVHLWTFIIQGPPQDGRRDEVWPSDRVGVF